VRRSLYTLVLWGCCGGAAWADPCAREQVLVRVPAVSAGVALTAASVSVVLVLESAPVDDVPMTRVAQARGRVQVSAVEPSAPSVAFTLSQANRPGMERQVNGNHSTTGPVSLADPEPSWSQCEQRMKGGGAQWIWNVPTASGKAELDLRTEFSSGLPCRIRVPLAGAWSPGARVEVSLELQGTPPPMTLNPSLPDGAERTERGWVLTAPTGDLVIDVPGCA